MSALNTYLASKKLDSADAAATCSELILDGINLHNLSDADVETLKKFIELKFLAMNDCHIASLAKFPVFETIEYVELHDNSLGSVNDAQDIVRCFPNLKVLMIAGNAIKSMDVFSELKKLLQLEEIDAEANPIFSSIEEELSTQLKEIFKMIPTLKLLNGLNSELEVVEKEQALESDSDGSGDDESDENDEDAEENKDRKMLKEFAFGDLMDEDEENEDYNPSAMDESEDSDSEDDQNSQKYSGSESSDNGSSD